MKTMVINFSGNVGKTTLAVHFIAPRLNDPDYIEVESTNSQAGDNLAVRGNQYGNILEAMALADDGIVDVGSSNAEDFTNLMRQYQGSHDDFDYFVVPTVAGKKEQIDTIKTINFLAELGIPAKKIRLLFNIVVPGEALEPVFAGLFDFHRAEKKFTLNTKAVIEKNEIFDKLKESGKTMLDVMNDPADPKEMLKAATTTEEKLQASRLLSLKRLAAGVTNDLDAVFKVLFR